MDYFNEAFDGFDPLLDRDAALKFVLDSLVQDKRFKHLDLLLSSDGQVDCLEGAPNWVIEKRLNTNHDWPSPADFRIFVSPEGYRLMYPEFFCEHKTFIRYLTLIINAYKRRHPEDMEESKTLAKLLHQQP